MPTFPPTPRQHRDEASFALAKQREKSIPEARTFALRLLRALEKVEEDNSTAFRELVTAQEIQDEPYQGVERRRVNREQVLS